MKKMTHKHLSTLALMTGLAVGAAAQAAEYEITVTNLTRSQPLTQIVAVTHIPSVKAF